MQAETATVQQQPGVAQALALLPGEDTRPLPVGSAVKAYHPSAKGVVQNGVIVSSTGRALAETRYKVRFDLARGKSSEWIPARDVLAILVGDAYTWRGR